MIERTCQLKSINLCEWARRMCRDLIGRRAIVGSARLVTDMGIDWACRRFLLIPSVDPVVASITPMRSLATGSMPSLPCPFAVS
jgi:hypothetical protein